MCEKEESFFYISFFYHFYALYTYIYIENGEEQRRGTKIEGNKPIKIERKRKKESLASGGLKWRERESEILFVILLFKKYIYIYYTIYYTYRNIYFTYFFFLLLL